MNNNINKKILEKINEIDNKSVQGFLLDAMQMEYDKRDEGKPRITKNYEKMIEKYISDYNDS